MHRIAHYYLLLLNSTSAFSLYNLVVQFNGCEDRCSPKFRIKTNATAIFVSAAFPTATMLPHQCQPFSKNNVEQVHDD